jgi:hypothetical protein
MAAKRRWLLPFLARKGLVAILQSKIAARPCNLDCSGNPAGFAWANPRNCSEKPGFFAVIRKKMRPNHERKI